MKPTDLEETKQEPNPRYVLFAKLHKIPLEQMNKIMDDCGVWPFTLWIQRMWREYRNLCKASREHGNEIRKRFGFPKVNKLQSCVCFHHEIFDLWLNAEIEAGSVLPTDDVLECWNKVQRKEAIPNSSDETPAIEV